MPNKFEVDVCIVGAGPSGAFLGLLLAKKGLSTLLLERTSGNTPAFRGEHIGAETEEMLKEHGLIEKVEEKGLLRTQRIDYIDHGNTLKSIYPGPNEKHLGIHVPQAHLIHTILDTAKNLPNFQLMYKTKVTELLTDEQGDIIGVQAKYGNETFSVKSKLIIGADGRYSTVRKLANLEVKTRSHGFDVLWAKIPAPNGWEPTIKNTLIDGMQVAVFPQALGNVQIGWNIPKGSFLFLKKMPIEHIKEHLLQHIPELRETVETNLTSWKNIILLDVFSAVTSTWVKNRVVIIRDAAHTMTPTGAYGINAGMKDAKLLVPYIYEAITSNNFDLLHEFERMRQPEIDTLLQKQVDSENNYAENFKLPTVV